MGKTIRASMLVLVLACSAQAGHIHNDVAGMPTPSASATQEGPAAAEDIQHDESGGLTETVLRLLESVLALL